MTLEWEACYPTGDTAVIELSLDLENKEDLVDVEQPRNKVNYASISLNLGVEDKAKTIELAEARLELSGLAVQPREIVSQPFHPGGEVVFYWNIKSNEEGDFPGRIWLYVVNQSLSGDGADRYPIAIQPVEFCWRNLLGLGGTAARYVGILGLTTSIFVLFKVVRHRTR
jgi:hypothetical protein